jgi:hypothetical protein
MIVLGKLLLVLILEAALAVRLINQGTAPLTIH